MIFQCLQGKFSLKVFKTKLLLQKQSKIILHCFVYQVILNSIYFVTSQFLVLYIFIIIKTQWHATYFRYFKDHFNTLLSYCVKSSQWFFLKSPSHPFPCALFETDPVERILFPHSLLLVHCFCLRVYKDQNLR